MRGYMCLSHECMCGCVHVCASVCVHECVCVCVYVRERVCLHTPLAAPGSREAAS